MFCLIFQVDPVRAKFLLKREVACLTAIMTRANLFSHVLAQRLPRISFARTCDQDHFSSLMHLDVGEVDLTSHIHSPTVSVQPYAFSDDLSACTG